MFIYFKFLHEKIISKIRNRMFPDIRYFFSQKFDLTNHIMSIVPDFNKYQRIQTKNMHVSHP